MPTCPSCTAEFDALPVDGACPRCGEKLPKLVAFPPSSRPAPVIDVAKNRRTLRVLLCVMFGIAALATLFILLTTNWRRRNDLPHLELTAHPLPSAEDSATLGMLPAGCSVIGEIKLRPLLKIRPGAQLMKKPIPAWIEVTVGKVHDWLGLKMGEIDDIALGLQNAGVPNLWLIVETSKDLVPAWFDAQYQRRPGAFRGRPMYEFKVGVSAGIVWLAYKRLAIIQLQSLPDSLTAWDNIPSDPRQRLDGIDAALHPIFTEKRVEPEHLAWFAGTRGGLKSLAPWLQAGNVSLDTLTDAAESFSVGLLLRDKATVSVNFFTAAEPKSDALKASLEKLTEPIREQVKIAPPQPGAPPAEQWVTLFVTLPIDDLRTGPVLSIRAKDE